MLMLTAIAATPSSPARFDNSDIKENRYDTRGKLGEHFAGAVEAGLDKVPFVPVEFSEFQVCFVEFEINQTHQRGDGDRGDRRNRAPKTPQPKTTIV